MRPTNEEITRHYFDDPPPGADPWVDGPSQPYEIVVTEYDARWPADFARVEGAIRDALGERVLELHHVGSTSVAGLPAKPVIDVDLVVADPADEASYLPELEAAGFVHTIREPWWHEHRLVTYADPVAYVHVFGPGCPEVVRHLMFQAWLRDHPDDLAAYADAKRTAAAAMNARPGGGTGMDYNRHKEPVVLAIYDRMFRAHGLLP
ncbi:GrpB family protein [Nocardioides cynanchi]|uniref:GrpB family protein n=1 Tax=Nocardioides cynanchi TaxID=2558918 RepID=UPI00192D32CA|nr:GrpB family protein [Nocardioides cynanchi]